MTRDARTLAVTLAAGGAALLLGLVPFEPLATFTPGRALSLPVAMLLGPWYGALAGLLAALPFGGPPSVRLVTLPLEAIVVGLVARRGWSPVLGAWGYWAAVGIVFARQPGWFGDAYLAYETGLS